MSDTLHPAEQTFLQEAARMHLPAYGAEVCTNHDIAWVVLEDASSREMPRFTICRIDPSVMVMVQNCAQGRRFESMTSVEDAFTFVFRSRSGRAVAGVFHGMLLSDFAMSA